MSFIKILPKRCASCGTKAGTAVQCPNKACGKLIGR